MRAAIGIDVGGTKLLAAVVDEDGRVLGEVSALTPRTRAELVVSLADLAAAALMNTAADEYELCGVGLGLPGLIDRRGVLHQAPNLRFAEEMEIGVELAPALLAACARPATGRTAGELSFVAENDATCAAAGELAHGAARGITDAVVLTLGTGIGGGLISAGRVVLGGQGFAGEVGHMVVVADGAPCACGLRGCWEQYASGTGIARLAHEAIISGRAPRLAELAAPGTTLPSEVVVEAARRGEKDAHEVLAEAAGFLALGLSNLSEILDPSAIIVGGGMSEAEDVLLRPALEQFAHYRRGTGPHRVQVRTASLGPRAGAIGASAFALGLA